MPRDKADFRAARAVLAAPYPLPVIITRPQRIPTPYPAVEPGVSSAGAITLGGFPFNPRWRDIPPAIPPVPYPPKTCGDTEQKRKWRIRLRRGVTAQSEVELMSGIEEGTSEEVNRLSALGALGALAGGATIPSLVSASFQSNLPAAFLDSPPIQPANPLTQANVTPRLAPPAIIHPRPVRAVPPTPGLIHPHDSISNVGVGRVPPGSPISSHFAWLASEEGDDEAGFGGTQVLFDEDWSPASARIVTPGDRAATPRPRPLGFFGKTNLAPFAAISHEEKTSIAGTDKTVVRIPRSRHTRARQEAEAAAAKEGVSSDGTVKPAKGTVAAPAPAGRVHGRLSAATGRPEPQYTYQPYPPGFMYPPPMYLEDIDYDNPPWTPMHVDPRTADVFHPSWPHELPSMSQPIVSPVRGTSRGLVLPIAPPSRQPAMLPPAKACHNYLLAHRLTRVKRAEAIREHNRQLYEQAQRDGTELVIGDSFKQHESTPMKQFQQVKAIGASAFATGDFWKPTVVAPLASTSTQPLVFRPRLKRRRDRSPDSYQLETEAAVSTDKATVNASVSVAAAGPSSDPQISNPDGTLPEKRRRRGEYKDQELSVFNLLLGQAGHLGREMGEEEKAYRRNAWLAEDRDRAASVEVVSPGADGSASPGSRGRSKRVAAGVGKRKARR